MANPANVQKVTIYFQDSNVSIGWSETYHILNPSLAAAHAEAQILCGLRAGFLPLAHTIPWVRTETLFSHRQFLASPPVFGGTLSGNYAVTSLMAPSVRALLELQGVGIGVTNRVFIGGIATADVTAQRWKPTNLFLGPFNAFATRLKTSSLGYVAFSRGNFSGAPRVNISSVTPTPPRGNAIVADTNAGLVPGSIVRISASASQIQGIQGYKIVTLTNGGLDFWVGGAVAVGEINEGAAAWYVTVTPTTQAILNCYINVLTERRVGRPFALPRGRQPNKIPLRL